MARGLCQPGGGASCGACCGLYNFPDHSRQALTSALARRTERIRQAPQTLEAYREAASQLRAQEHGPLFSEVRICPLLGFLDPAQARVGCLAHPAVTGGKDLRDCGAYNVGICASFECPSFLWLSDEEALLIRDACPDWYLYGLVVTDVEFVRGCLSLIANAAGAEISSQRLHRDALEQVGRLFALKERAPGREEGAAIFGRFLPDGTGDGTLRTLDYLRLGLPPAPEDGVVLCLGFSPRTGPQLEGARALVRAAVDSVVRALPP